MNAPAALLGIDWGTTSFRAYRMDATGAVLDTTSAAAGILKVPGGDFEGALWGAIGAWLEAEPDAPLIASGMITSRQGWLEVPYRPCPAGSPDLASGLVAHAMSGGRAIHFVPGVSLIGEDGVPDVLRGEETQVMGEIGAAGRGLLVLPGTHSKWILAEGGRLVWFATFLTGELFGVLKDHSILGRLMQGTALDESVFKRGLAYARTGPGGLLKRLFSARTLGLFDMLPESGIASYLSGLLIGSETLEALACLDQPKERLGEVIVIGEPELAGRYLVALATIGLRAREAAEHASARGLFTIARAAGLVS